MNRRNFLVSTLALSACATTAIYRVPFQDGRIQLNLQDHPELAEPGGVILLKSDQLADAVVLIHTDQGFTALSSVCTHLGCSVRPSSRFLLCPCHGSTFDHSGKVLRGPAEKSLMVFETIHTNHTVEIAIPTL